MKDDSRDIDDPVPSYEESSRLANYSASDTKPPRRPLQTQLAEGRSSRIRNVLAAYVEPLLDTQIQNCVARNTLYHPLCCLEPYPEHREHLLVEDKVAEPCAMSKSSDSSGSSASATSEKNTAVYLTELFDGK